MTTAAGSFSSAADRKIEHYEAAEHGVDVGCSDDPVSSVRLSSSKV
jgi:hypothetical protein